MNTIASLAFGAVALTAASIGFAEPAAARGNVGIYVSPYGLGINVDSNRDYCRDSGYRHRYYDNCNRYQFNDAYYSDRGEDYRWQQNHRHRHHHHDRYDDRDGNHYNNYPY